MISQKSVAALREQEGIDWIIARKSGAVRVGKVVNQYKVAKHITLDIKDQAFSFQRKTQSIAAEAALDGIYVIRTSLKTSRMDGADCVRHYKSLAQVERAFHTLKYRSGGPAQSQYPQTGRRYAGT